MVIDLTKCIGCHSCTQACKETYDLPEGAWRCWVTKIRRTDGLNQKDLFLPRLCNQCEHPPCVKVCPVQATYKNENGLVVQRYDRCIGCKYCMMACPYNMRYVHPKLKVVDKCTFCDHRVKNGLEPACVAACPPRVRTFGDLNDNTSAVAKLVTTMPTTVLKPELGTEPRVFYIGADKDLEEARIHARK
jgi:tetrathionate reductase subunit B